MADEKKEPEKKEPTVIKVMKMIYDALFSPSQHDELYKPSELIPGMTFYYLITVIVVIVVLYLVLRYFGFL
ncbi:Uncharacterised protein [uncultured archaeon]|nr:Uncharacterised protein [uncultured archaeon]